MHSQAALVDIEVKDWQGNGRTDVCRRENRDSETSGFVLDTYRNDIKHKIIGFQGMCAGKDIGCSSAEVDNNSKEDEIVETSVQDNNSAKSVKFVPKVVLPIFTAITWIRINTAVPAALVQ